MTETRRRVLYWQVLVGGRGREDAAITDVVVPALADVGRPVGDGWHLLRYFDERGPHLRVRLHVQPDEAEAMDVAVHSGLTMRLGELLVAGSGPPWRSLVRTPPHLDTRGRGTGVHAAIYEREVEKYGTHDGVHRAEDVWSSSSAGAVQLLADIGGDPLRRTAVVAALASRVVDQHFGPDEAGARAFWLRFGLFWSGGDNPRGRTVLARAAALVAEIGLVRAVEDAAGDARVAAVADAVAGATVRGCRLGETDGRVPAATLLFHHVHLTDNRVGISPAEEPLVGAVALAALGA